MAGQRNGRDSMNLGQPGPKEVGSFFIGKFEVRNKDYRQFVHYVRDSLAHTLCGHFVNKGNARQLDWNAMIDWKDEKLESLMLSPDDRLYGRKEIDVTKLIYRNRKGQDIAVYPDTLVWIRDFAYSYNEPMTKRYFSHPAFNNYPVVGVNRLQAMAYCDYLSCKWNEALAALNETAFCFEVRLPTSEEWEYAAQAEYPLLVTDSTQIKSYSPVIHFGQRTKNNGFKYNFGKYFDMDSLLLKSYFNDGFFYTAPCNTYKPNKFGLYNLLGNVSEWTSSNGSYHPVYSGSGINEEMVAFKRKFPHSPLAGMKETEIDVYLKKFAIVKGGGWSTDELFYLQPGANEYVLPDGSGHCYLGFRIAASIVPVSQ